MIPVGLMRYVRKIHRDHEVAPPLRRAPGAGPRPSCPTQRHCARPWPRRRPDRRLGVWPRYHSRHWRL